MARNGSMRWLFRRVARDFIAPVAMASTLLPVATNTFAQSPYSVAPFNRAGVSNMPTPPLNLTAGLAVTGGITGDVFTNTGTGADGYADTGTHAQSALNLTGIHSTFEAISLNSSNSGLGAVIWFTAGELTANRWGLFYPDQTGGMMHYSFPAHSFDIQGGTAGEVVINSTGIQDAGRLRVGNALPGGQAAYASVDVPSGYGNWSWQIDNNDVIEVAVDNTGRLIAKQSVVFANVTYATLPATGTTGAQVFCTDCLKPGETAAAGTGMMVFDDGHAHWVSMAGTVAAH